MQVPFLSLKDVTNMSEIKNVKSHMTFKKKD